MRKHEILDSSRTGSRTKITNIGLTRENLERLKIANVSSPEVIVADIDQDGSFLSFFGPIKHLPTISREKFLPRKRFHIQLIAKNNLVGIKKHFKGDKISFLRELTALYHLGRYGCSVPSIMDVDFDNLTITLSFILGSVLREKMAEKGAIIRDRDLDQNPNYIGMTQHENWYGRILEGKRVLYDVIDHNLVDRIFFELKKIHTSNIVLNDIKYGNIIIEGKTLKPYFIDFDTADYYPGLGKNTFWVLRDKDIELFNLHFDTNKFTYRRIRENIRKGTYSSIKSYAPVYFGLGLKIGPIWNTETGYGRWHYILKRSLPSFEGNRILDLGCNNGSVALQILQNGAREVVGVELESKYITQGEFVKEAMQWANNRIYDFKYLQINMTEVPKQDLGTFDCVLALCSIYYLNDNEIEELIRHISSISNKLILQTNTARNIDRKNNHTYEKASLEYAVTSLKKNGFPITKVIAPNGYDRPLVIGVKGH